MDSHAAHLAAVTEAHDAGKAAWAAGQDEGSCPHPPHPKGDAYATERRYWLRGYRAACKAHGCVGGHPPVEYHRDQFDTTIPDQET